MKAGSGSGAGVIDPEHHPAAPCPPRHPITATPAKRLRSTRRSYLIVVKPTGIPGAVPRIPCRVSYFRGYCPSARGKCCNHLILRENTHGLMASTLGFTAKPWGSRAEPSGSWLAFAGLWAKPAGSWLAPAGSWAASVGSRVEPLGSWDDPARHRECFRGIFRLPEHLFLASAFRFVSLAVVQFGNWARSSWCRRDLFGNGGRNHQTR